MSSPPGQHQSLWRATVGAVTRHPPLDGDLDTDVAVVGAGVTGLTTALLLAEAGLQVTVVEARRVGAGTTGGTTGKVTSQHGLHYAGMAATFGDDAARAYARANQAAIDDIERLAIDHGIDCDLTRLDAWVYADDGQARRKLQQETAAAVRAGLPAEFVDTLALPYPTHGGMRFTDQVQLHPLRYLHGLADAAVDAGARIAEQTRVHAFEEEGGVVVLATERGTVRARHAVVATLLPIFDRGFEFARTRPTRSYGIAARLAAPPFAGMYIAAGEPSRSLRLAPAPDGGTYLVVVGESHETGHGDRLADHYAELVAFARRHFDVVSVDFRWSAQDYMPADGVPYVGRLSFTDRVQIATGFKKWGLTNGTVAARLMADAIEGRDNPWAPLFDANRVEPAPGAVQLVKDNLHVAQRFVADRFVGVASSTDDVDPGSGAIVRVEGEPVAISRDDAGAATAVTAVCSHLGCVVQWNDAEASWDCPCHGSRFDRSGAVLDGPATEPLDPRAV